MTEAEVAALMGRPADSLADEAKWEHLRRHAWGNIIAEPLPEGLRYWQEKEEMRIYVHFSDGRVDIKALDPPQDELTFWDRLRRLLPW
jgi:hypothetical protein